MRVCLSGFWYTSFISAVEAFGVDCVHLLYPVAFSFLQRVRFGLFQDGECDILLKVVEGICKVLI